MKLELQSTNEVSCTCQWSSSSLRCLPINGSAKFGYTLKPYAQRTIQLDETQMQKSSQLSFQESDVIYSKPGVDPLETYATHNIVFMTVSQSVSQSINQIHTA